MATNILNLTESAVIAYLTPFAGTANVYEAKNSAEKAAPAVCINAVSAEEDPPMSGNFWVNLEVSARTIAAVNVGEAADDPKTASDALSESIFEALEVDDLADQLSNAETGYVVMGFGVEKSFDTNVEGDCWIETWKRKLYCGRFDS